MAKSISHRNELANRRIEILGLCGEKLPVYTQASVPPEHTRNFLERKARSLPYADEGKSLHDRSIKQAV
jgi:hypothetical protein